MSGTIIVFDALPMCYQAQSTVGHFSTKNGVSTGLRYGVLRTLRSLSKLHKAEKTIICWDTPEPIKKAESHTSYKSNRPWTNDKIDMYSKIPELQDMLALTYYTQVSAPGHEADDLCFTIANMYEKQFGKKVITVTVDRDSWAGVTDNVSVFMNGKEKLMVTPKEVDEVFGVKPHQVPLHKAVLGDKSDNIPPLIKGEIASRFHDCMRKNGNWENVRVLDWFFGPDSDNYVEAMLNLRLTTLHQVPQTEWVIRKGTRDEKGLTSLFETLEFKSMMDSIPQLTRQGTPWLPEDFAKKSKSK